MLIEGLQQVLVIYEIKGNVLVVYKGILLRMSRVKTITSSTFEKKISLNIGVGCLHGCSTTIQNQLIL